MHRTTFRKAKLGQDSRAFLVRLPSAEYSDLRQVAVKNGKSLNFCLIEALRFWILTGGSKLEN